MTRKRIGIVHSPGTSEWTSCRAIGANLKRAYRIALGTEGIFFACDWRRPSDLRRTAERIREADPEELVFLDHSPHPDTLLVPLKSLFSGKGLPRIRFHIYGDFTRNSREWLGSEKLLRGAPVQWICASERQVRLVSGMLAKPERSVVLCPFPVSSEIYSVDSKARERWRSKLDLSPEDLLVVYAGRFSLQKNCDRLLDEVLRFSVGSEVPVHFALAGTFDDLGSPFFGIVSRPGSSRREWSSFLRKLPPRQRGHFRHLGSLEPSELRGLYNAADIAASLSLYHDEDFGMFPAEALCCGTPCVLTSWGGYASFPGTRHVPVRLGRRGLEFSSRTVQHALRSQASLSRSVPARIRRSQSCLSKYSIEAISDRIRKIRQSSPPPFRGFSPKMHEHARRMNSGALFDPLPRLDPFYARVYAPYFQD